MLDIHGDCEPGFGRVADVFRAHFAAGQEVGASLGIYQHGKPVVNLWGGLADPHHRRPWQANTVTPLASTSKSLAAIAMLVLADRGLIDLDAPVATYWPAFAANGKDTILVRWVLAHRSGLAALDAPISNDDAQALTPVLQRIEQQAPWWPPGTRHGYHAMTFGFILSGLVLKVTGLTIGRFFAREIAQPLGLELYLGAAPAMHDRIAPMIGPSQAQALRALLHPRWLRYGVALARRSSVSYRATFGGTSVSFDDGHELHRYEVEDASAGGVGNGIALARVFAALLGEVDGIRLLRPDMLEAARTPQASGHDEVLKMRTDWGLGFALPGGPNWPDIGVTGLFGHTGASGSLVFGDAEHELAFGYTPNLWVERGGWVGTPRYRFERLAVATYQALGVPVRTRS